ncbi:MAG: DUF2179 domain-containing protein [Clostridia bacterium]
MDFLIMAIVQILYVAFNSFRVVLMIKGRTNLAAMISTVEVFVYLTGLAIVLRNLDSPIGILIYCCAYGVGILTGVYIERKIALGYITLQVISEENNDMAEILREKGYGVTSWHGEGATGTRMVYMVLTKRKEYKALRELIQEIDPKAFIVSFEPNTFVGGFWTKKIH